MFQRSNFVIIYDFSLKSKNMSHLSYPHACVTYVAGKRQACGALSGLTSPAPGWGLPPPRFSKLHVVGDS